MEEAVHFCNTDILPFRSCFDTDVVVRFFLCFSLIQNINRIMDTKVPPSAISSIHGIRVLSMWWVILGHTYFFAKGIPISKYSKLSPSYANRNLNHQTDANQSGCERLNLENEL